MIAPLPPSLDGRPQDQVDALLEHLDDGGVLLFKSAYEGQQDYIADIADWRTMGGENNYVLHYPVPNLRQTIDRAQMASQLKWSRAHIIAYA